MFGWSAFGPGDGVARLLINGSVDAMIYPHPPHAIFEAGDRVWPLFRDRKAEAFGYYRKLGYYPIMHLIDQLVRVEELLHEFTWSAGVAAVSTCHLPQRRRRTGRL